MVQQILNNLVPYGEQRTKINGNFTELYSQLDTETVLVNELSDLPTPVGSNITLADNTKYLISGNISLGTNRITYGANSVIRGNSFFIDTLTYNGTGDMFSAVNNNLVTQSVTIVAASCNQVFNFNGDGSQFIVLEKLVADGTPKLGSLEDFDVCTMSNLSLNNNTSGFSFAGSLNNICIFQTALVTGNSGTFLDLGTALFNSFDIFDCPSIVIPGGAAFLSGLAASGNITNGGKVSRNVFSGAGTFLTNIDNCDLKWDFGDNSGNGGIEDTKPGAGITMPTNATATVISAINTPVIIAGTFTEHNICRFATTAAGRATYIGLEDIVARVSLNFFAVPVSGTNTIYTSYIAVNGVVNADYISKLQLDSGDGGQYTNFADIMLSTNDFIEVFIENNSGTTNVTVDAFKMIIDS